MQYISLNTYILPHCDLCYVIWGNCTHNLEEKTSETGCPSNSWLWRLYPIMYDVFRIKMEDICRTFLYQKAIQMFKTIEGNAPEYLRTSFTFATDSHSRLLRSSSFFQLYTPKPHLEIYRNTSVFFWSIHLEYSFFIYSKHKLSS